MEDLIRKLEMSDYYDGEDSDDDEDEDDSDDDSFSELPQIVQMELDRRAEIKKKYNLKKKKNPNSAFESSEAANPAIINEFRRHYESGKFDPSNHGKALEILYELGVKKPSSTEPMVKDIKANCWMFRLPGDMTEEEEHTNWNIIEEKHRATVRLLRYGEFADSQYLKFKQQEIRPERPKDAGKGEDNTDLKSLEYFKKCYYLPLEDDDINRAINNKEFGPDVDFHEYMKQYDTDDDNDEDRGDTETAVMMPNKPTNTTSVSLLTHVKQYGKGFKGFRKGANKQTEPMDPISESIPICMGFTYGFFGYCNIDKVKNGAAAGGTKVNELNMLEMECSITVMEEQCQELRLRYQEQKRPLGSFVNQTQKNSTKQRGKNKKKNRKNGGMTDVATKTHATKIQETLSDLFRALRSVVTRPALCFAEIFEALIPMFGSAAVADLDIARTFCGNEVGRIVLSLRRTAADFATQIDLDTSIPKYFADKWWGVYGNLTLLLSRTVRHLFDEETCPRSRNDLALAAEFFRKEFLPELEKSCNITKSSSKSKDDQYRSACEQIEAWKAIDLLMSSGPKHIALDFVSNKKAWKLIESVCKKSVRHHVAKKEWKTQRARTREEWSLPQVKRAALNFVSNICGRGMEENVQNANMTPGALALKTLYRGAVPLLMSCVSDSCDGEVRFVALNGLAQLSRVKDCRQILLQWGNSLDILRDGLLSNDGASSSAAMLLALHLFWDPEWRDPIMSIEPPVETICMKWAAYSLKSIMERAYEVRSVQLTQREGINQKLTDLIRLQHKKNRTYEEEKKMSEYEDLQNQLQNQRPWQTFESEISGDCTDYCASRSMLLLSTIVVHKDAHKRFNKIDFLPLAAACLDSKQIDLQCAALGVLGNYIASSFSHNYAMPQPSDFPDPDHIIDSLEHHMDMAALNKEPGSKREMSIIQLAKTLTINPKWCSHLKKIQPDSVLSMMLGQVSISSNLPGSKKYVADTTTKKYASDTATKGRGESYEDMSYLPIVSKGCSTLTGGLKSCSLCGKMEKKRKQMKSCSACKTVQYCNRECQKAHWKKHKKDCASLAAAKVP